MRRYRCRHCNAVITVVPLEVVAHRLFSGAAIALALGLFGLAKLTAATVRARVSPWSKVGHEARAGWASLWRWLKAARQGRLFAKLQPLAPRPTWREMAEDIASTLAAWALPSRERPREELAFLGAARMA